MSKIPVALQLYSVRHYYGKDWKDTIRKVKEMGYEGIEFYGPFQDADELNDLLKETGLILAGWHVGLDLFTDEKFDETLAYFQKIGLKYAACPWIKPEEGETWDKYIAEFGRIAKKLAPYGIKFGYHNHAHEFEVMEDGRTVWEYIYDNADPALFMQLDNGNAMNGDGKPLDMLKKYPGRATTVHLKPYDLNGAGYDTMIGQDSNDWDALLTECETNGGTEIYIVEYESEKLYDEMVGVKLCLEELHKLGR